MFCTNRTNPMASGLMRSITLHLVLAEAPGKSQHREKWISTSLTKDWNSISKMVSVVQ